MSAAALQLLFVPVVAQSAGALLWLALKLRQQGGRVRPEGLQLPDLMAAAGLTAAFVQISVLGFRQHAAVMSLRPAEILALPLFILTIACALAGFMVFRRISLADLYGWRRTPVWRQGLWAAGLLLVAVPAVYTVTFLSQHLLKEAAGEQLPVGLFRSELRQGHYGVIGAIAAAAVILAPLGEEFLFRGYLYPVGKRYFGATPSAVLSAVLFALMHTNAVAFAGLFLLALCFTLAYERTGSLLVPMTMHALFNAFNLLLLAGQVWGGPS